MRPNAHKNAQKNGICKPLHMNLMKKEKIKIENLKVEHILTTCFRERNAKIYET